MELNNLELEREEKFSLQIVSQSEDEKIVGRALQIQPNVCALTPESPAILEYDVRFDPLKPFECMVELVIEKESGGRWRYQLTLEATEPDVDDTITIESSINHTASVSFKLTNQFREKARFQSEFTTGSSPAFSIFPNIGELEPYGGEPTKFIVSFSPTEYGKILTGRLVICTDEMQWTFDVRGTHPEYIRPVGQARVFSKNT